MTMTLIEKRDAILASLRATFICRVAEINIYDPLNGTYRVCAISAVHGLPPTVETLLLEIANNAAQGLADDGDRDDHAGVTQW